MGEPLTTGLAIGLGSTLASGLFSYATTPGPNIDATNYALLRQTQEQADAESDEAKARTEAARKREELRQQALRSSQVLTSDAGASGQLQVRETILGSGR